MGYYVVLPGDTLSSIAQKQLGDANKARAIAALNKLKNMNQIRVGQKLQLPSDNTAAESSPPQADPVAGEPSQANPLTKPLTASPAYEICPYEVNSIQLPPYQHFALYPNFQHDLTKQWVLPSGYSRPLDELKQGTVPMYLVLPEDNVRIPATAMTGLRSRQNLLNRFATSQDYYAAEATESEEASKEIIKPTKESDSEAKQLIADDLKRRKIDVAAKDLDAAEVDNTFYTSKVIFLPDHLELTSDQKKLTLHAQPNQNCFVNYPDDAPPEDAYRNIIRSIEGFSTTLYTDGPGYPTTGIGWLVNNAKRQYLIYFKSDGKGGFELTDSPTNSVLIECYTDQAFTVRASEAQIKAEINKVHALGRNKPLGLGDRSGIFLKPGYIETMTTGMVKSYANGMRASLPDFDSYPLPAQIALIDISFNCGKYIMTTGRAQSFKQKVISQDWKGAIDYLFDLRDPRARENKVLLTNENHHYILSNGLKGFVSRNMKNAQWFLAAQKIKDSAQ